MKKYNLLYASLLAIPVALIGAGNAQAADTDSTDQTPVENVAQTTNDTTSTTEATANTQASQEAPQAVATSQQQNAPLVVENDPTEQTAQVQATSEPTVSSTEPTTGGNYTEGRAYWVANPDYYIWDTPYSETSQVVAKAADYTHTVFKGLNQVPNAEGNLYEQITNNDNVTGWIYLPALSESDPNEVAPAPEAPATTTDTSTDASSDADASADAEAPADPLDTIKDTADKIGSTADSVTSAIDKTQSLLQEPGKVITNGITNGLTNLTDINNAATGNVTTVIDNLSKTSDSLLGLHDSAKKLVSAPITDLKDAVNDLGQTGQAIFDNGKGALDNFRTAAKDAANDVSNIYDGVTGAVKKVAGTAGDVLDGINSGVSKVTDTVENVADGIKKAGDAVSSITSGISGVVSKATDAVSGLTSAGKTISSIVSGLAGLLK
ncbi:hypothetical protein [Companilactobacillus furfuricola]|uniref:hypothetical protein n=1 Tax=Companilactobacillus furfuricola TaxID=1462575 RepID=UPI000F79D40B|nr:hypothetical protein [Companilactobacillus furfuricola]